MPDRIFDGVKFAGEIEENLRESEKLVGKSLLILSNKDSLYVKLKQRMGERLGVDVRVKILSDRGKLLTSLTEADDFDGVLVQLPVLGLGKKDQEGILGLIPVDKDVDGLNPESSFWPAAVVAVEKIFSILDLRLGISIGVVGSEGMIGKRLVKRFSELGFAVLGFDKGDSLKDLKKCDVAISVTGQAGLIKPEMVGDGVVVIDLGFPQGDFEGVVAKKAEFFTPVPGGVGPVTVVSLFENLAKV